MAKPTMKVHVDIIYLSRIIIITCDDLEKSAKLVENIEGVLPCVHKIHPFSALHAKIDIRYDINEVVDEILVLLGT